MRVFIQLSWKTSSFMAFVSFISAKIKKELKRVHFHFRPVPIVTPPLVCLRSFPQWKTAVNTFHVGDSNSKFLIVVSRTDGNLIYTVSISLKISIPYYAGIYQRLFLLFTISAWRCILFSAFEVPFLPTCSSLGSIRYLLVLRVKHNYAFVDVQYWSICLSILRVVIRSLCVC